MVGKPPSGSDEGLSDEVHDDCNAVAARKGTLKPVSISVEQGSDGTYRAVAPLTPHFQLEALDAALKLISHIPPAVIAAASAAGGAALQARLGRKVRLKVGDIEAEASSIAEVEQLLGKAREFGGRTSDEP